MNSAERSLSANLDLLRSIAVLLVLAQHLAKRANIDQIAWMPTGSWGIFGVLLFFVHTCLVLMYSMERSGLTGWALIKNFATRRIFRIYPLSVLTVLTALALHLDSDINGIHGLSRGHFPGLSAALSNLLLVQNLIYAKSIVNVLWTLPYELQMYALLPFLYLWIRRNSLGGKKMVWPLIALWIASMVAGAVQPHVPSLGRLSILLFLPCFLPGVLAYALPHRPRIPSIVWPLFILLLVAIFAAQPLGFTGPILSLLLGWMIPQFREIPWPWLRWTSNRIATYSYGIYLSHQFAIWTAFGVLASRSLAIRIPVLVVMLVGLPVLLFHTIEKPMIGVGVRLAAKLCTSSSSSSSAARHILAPAPARGPIIAAVPDPVRTKTTDPALGEEAAS